MIYMQVWSYYSSKIICNRNCVHKHLLILYLGRYENPNTEKKVSCDVI